MKIIFHRKVGQKYERTFRERFWAKLGWKYKRLHDEENSNSGVLILQSDPQMRTLYLSGHKLIRRVALPYLISIIRYRLDKKANGKITYIYQGLNDQGLRILFSKNSISSFQEDVYLSPTDLGVVVCTDHDSDNKEFGDLYSLVNHVMNLWYSSLHYLPDEYDDRICWQNSRGWDNWSDLTLDNVLKYKWKRYCTLQEVFRRHRKEIPLSALIRYEDLKSLKE